jgi:hypothetical protein
MGAIENTRPRVSARDLDWKAMFGLFSPPHFNGGYTERFSQRQAVNVFDANIW